MIRIFSFGGGVQSTAALVLAARGRIDYRVFLFCNVGEDSENPATLEYIEKYSKPYAKAHGLEFYELRKIKRSGEIETLAGRVFATKRSVPIPAYMSNGAPGNRSCTIDFKIKVIARWLKQHGAAIANPAMVGLGISLDESQRMRLDSGIAWEKLEYPLIDLRLKRTDCMKIIEEAGLPVPPKSSCFFCPFHRPSEWNRIKRDEPELFQQAIAIECKINETRQVIKRDRVYLHRWLVPLEDIEGIQTEFNFDGDDNCESGYCVT